LLDVLIEPEARITRKTVRNKRPTRFYALLKVSTGARAFPGILKTICFITVLCFPILILETLHSNRLWRAVSLAPLGEMKWYAWLVGTGFFLTRGVFHEIGHSIVCSLLTRRPVEVGLSLVSGMPRLVSDVSRSVLLPSLRGRLLILMGGTMADIVALTLLTSVSMILDASVVYLFVSITVLTLLANLVLPFANNDGHLILQDLSRIDNLGLKAASASWCSLGIGQADEILNDPWWLPWYGFLQASLRIAVVAAFSGSIALAAGRLEVGLVLGTAGLVLAVRSWRAQAMSLRSTQRWSQPAQREEAAP
jgi:hypothetical protein